MSKECSIELNKETSSIAFREVGVPPPKYTLSMLLPDSLKSLPHSVISFLSSGIYLRIDLSLASSEPNEQYEQRLGQNGMLVYIDHLLQSATGTFSI